VVRQVAAGTLAHGQYEREFLLPSGSRGLSVHGTVERIDGGCGQRAFFMTVTGFSPDPYGGLEFVEPGCEPEPDPLGSGGGQVVDLGDGWFWIEAR
jgi:hypothetical protein